MRFPIGCSVMEEKGAGFLVKLQFFLISNLFFAIVILFIMLPEERAYSHSFVRLEKHYLESPKTFVKHIYSIF